MREQNLPFVENERTSTLQEQLERTASNIEKQEHTIFKNDQIIVEARSDNIAILSRSALQYAIATHRLPAEKLHEFDQFPLSHRLGFIHSLPEEDFDIGSARITDVGYAGFFPKAILHDLHRYARKIRNSNEDNTELVALIENLTTAFI